jgi:four helix bundle protein
MAGKIETHHDLRVYQKAFQAAMQVFDLTKAFPREETYSLSDQIRRSSRSVCANLTEAWRKRRYEAAFVAKLSDAESEAAETQVWLEFAVKCGYIRPEDGASLCQAYDEILTTIVGMIHHPETWVLGYRDKARTQGEKLWVTQSPPHLVTMSPCQHPEAGCAF